MLKRQLAKGEAQEENEALVRQSVEDARRAVSLDIADFKSWYVLGNAFLTSYFVASAPSLSILQQALKAYQNAEKNMPGGGYSDLHFNRGIVCQYLDRYQEALESFRAAKDLDATLSEPCDQHVHSLLHTMSVHRGTYVDSCARMWGRLTFSSEQKIGCVFFKHPTP